MSYQISAVRNLAAAVGLGLAGCAQTGSLPPEDLTAQLIEERRAEEQRALERTRAFTARMQEAFQEEARDPAWADRFETMLTSSYERDRTVPDGALRQVQCRTSRCVLDFSVTSAKDAVRARSSVLAWLSGSQPCGYYLEAPAPEDLQRDSFEQRVYVECNRQMSG